MPACSRSPARRPGRSAVAACGKDDPGRAAASEVAVTATDTACSARRSTERRGRRDQVLDHQHRREGHRVLRLRAGDRVMGEVENIGPRTDPRPLASSCRPARTRASASRAWSATASSAAFTVTGAAAPLTDGRRSSPTRSPNYQRYVQSQTGAAGRRPRSSSTRSRPATSPRPRRSSRSPAPTTSDRAGGGELRRPRPGDRRAARATSSRAWSGPASTRIEKHLWVDRRHQQGTAAIADQLDADVKRRSWRRPTSEARPAADRQRRQGAARRGGHQQDHRRGGPLLAHRPVGLRGQRRRRQGGRRRAAAGARPSATPALMSDAGHRVRRRARPLLDKHAVGRRLQALHRR